MMSLSTRTKENNGSVRLLTTAPDQLLRLQVIAR